MEKKLGFFSMLIIAIIIVVGYHHFFDKDKFEGFEKEDCKYVDIQQLDKDYEDNEISAEEKYKDNFYYFTEEITDITKSDLGDSYLTLRFQSSEENRVIDIDAHFDNDDDLKKVTKGDLVTIYGQFRHRTIHDYMNTLNTYSFYHCKMDVH